MNYWEPLPRGERSSRQDRRRARLRSEGDVVIGGSSQFNQTRKESNTMSSSKNNSSDGSNPRKRQSSARSPSNKETPKKKTRKPPVGEIPEPPVLHDDPSNSKQHTSTLPTDPQAEMLGQKLGQTPTYLTHDGKSWVIHVKRWLPTPSRDAFLAEWNLHPQSRHEIQVYGKTCLEKRWSQSWGFSYKYSGNVNAARPIEESTMIRGLLDTINGLLLIDEEDNDDNNTPQEERPYNGCLQNWYTPNDHIGLHADDERSLNSAYPIWSLSWGGTRRFLLRPKKSKKKTAVNNNNHIIISDEPIELLLEDGDMVLMGGTCQETHKHEVPKFRKTMDPPTSDRINWTIRAFQPSS